MKTKYIGNLFELAEKQLIYEVKKGQRKKITMVDLIDYAISLRKTLDRFGKREHINRVRNIKTNKIVWLESKKEIRHRKYLKERRKLK